MLGQQRTVHKTEAACQRRCASVIGCAHFSYQADTGGCHIQDKDALPHPELGIISGPAHCSQPKVIAPPPPPPPAPVIVPNPPPANDVWHKNPALMPSLIAAGGVAAAGGIAGIAVAAAQAAHHHDDFKPHPTFPPLGPTTSHRQKGFAADRQGIDAAAAIVGVRRRQNDSGSAQSGVWLFLLACAAALSAIGLAIAAWYCLCHRSKSRAGNTYTSLQVEEGDYEGDEVETTQRYQEGLDVEALRKLYKGDLPEYPKEYVQVAPVPSFYASQASPVQSFYTGQASPVQSFYAGQASPLPSFRAGQALQQQPINGNDPPPPLVPLHNPHLDTRLLRSQ